MNERYVPVDIEIIRFAAEDIITTSDENELPED